MLSSARFNVSWDQRSMFFLRILSFIAGSFVGFATPFFVLTERQGLALGGLPAIFAGALAVLLFGLIYFHFALSGHRIVRSRRRRKVAAALILFQLAAGGWLLHLAGNPQTLFALAPLMCFSLMLFLAFVWPGDSGHNHRPMRRRDNADQLQPR